MGHNHSHSTSGNIKVAFFLNLGFTILEIFGGLLTNSIAILSDALHDRAIAFLWEWPGILIISQGRRAHPGIPTDIDVSLCSVP